MNPISIFRQLAGRIGMVVGIAACAAAIGVTSVYAASATFTVNSTGDGDDSVIGDGVCDVGSSECTLRAAIQEANATGDTDTIQFNIPGGAPYLIRPGVPLPAITHPVVIDGTTQPGFVSTPIVELDGTNLPHANTANGLIISGGSSTIRGLVINRFYYSGIRLNTAGGNTIAGNYIGTNVAGDSALPNGVGIIISSNDNLVGGTTTPDRNVVSGNNNGGVAINNGASGNMIKGNIIGLDAGGTAVLGTGSPVGVDAYDAGSTIIGGAEPGAGNVIGGLSVGIELGSGCIVQGNLVGTDITGTVDLGNHLDGIRSYGPNNIIGGASASARNVVSGNDNYGINVTLASTNTVVQGNYVGTDITGMVGLGNTWSGIHVSSANADVIDNLVSGNGVGPHGIYDPGSGIEVSNDVTPYAQAVLIQGNWVGTNKNGSAALSNYRDGVLLRDNANGVTIGGTTAQERNIISGNTQYGIRITSGSNGSIVQGSYIGVAGDSSTALGNQMGGILISDSTVTEADPPTQNNTIGGDVSGAGNVISGNLGNGVTLAGKDITGTTIQGNTIGPNAAGTASLGSQAVGIQSTDAAATVIGGSSAAAANLISGNGSHGISVTFASNQPANTVSIIGNRIGVDGSGAHGLGNGPTNGNGIMLSNVQATVQDNFIGFNTGYAISAGNATLLSSTGNCIEGNSLGLGGTGSEDIQDNWWASPKGPMVNGNPETSLNPDGNGQRIIFSGNTSLLHYTPYLTTPPASCGGLVVLPPAAPGNFTAGLPFKTQIPLKWANHATDNSAVSLVRSPDGVSGWMGFSIPPGNMFPPNTTSFTDTVGLACGTTYYYHLRAYRASDQSYSDAATLVTSTLSCSAPDETAKPPSAPKLVSPKSGTKSINRVPTFTWRMVSTATSYRFQVARDSKFHQIELDEPVGGLTYTPVTPLGEGLHYWRVAAVNYNMLGKWSKGLKYTVDTTPPPVPTVKSPLDGSLGVKINPKLVVKKSRGAVTYIFEISTDPLFGSNVFGATGKKTSYSVSSKQPLLRGTVYYWRVAAVDKLGNTSTFSGPWSFTTVP